MAEHNNVFVPARLGSYRRRIRLRGRRGAQRAGQARVHYFSRLILPAYDTPIVFRRFDGSPVTLTSGFFTVGSERTYVAFSGNGVGATNWDTWLHTGFRCRWSQLYQNTDFSNLYTQGKILSIWCTWNPNEGLYNDAVNAANQVVAAKCLGYVDTMVDAERFTDDQTRAVMANNSAVKVVDMGKKWSMKIKPYVSRSYQDADQITFRSNSSYTPWLDLTAGTGGDANNYMMMFNLGIAFELIPGFDLPLDANVNLGYFTFKAQIACRESH